MKYKLQLFAIGVSLLYLLSGCGASAQSPAAPEETAQRFGAENPTGTSEPASETAAPRAAQTPNPQTAAESTAEAAQSGLPTPDEQALLSAMLADYQDGLSYDPEDPVYFWRAVGYLAGSSGQASDGAVKLSAGELAPYVEALFGPYTLQYPSLGEENPLVSEEYVNGQTLYTVTASGPFDQTVTMTEPEAQGDGTYLCHAELVQGTQILAGYTVTLRDYSGSGTRFTHSIAGLTPD